MLVLSERRSHLILLKKMLDDDSTIIFTYGLFLGSMKINELEKSKSCDVILATYAAFSEGVSEKDLNTLILVSPKKYVNPNIKNNTNKKNDSGKLNQIVGRIFRKKHIEHNPLIIDLYDKFSVYKSQGNSRKVFYKEHFKNGIFKEESINLDDNEVINIDCLKRKNKRNKVIKKIIEIDEIDEIDEINKCIL